MPRRAIWKLEIPWRALMVAEPLPVDLPDGAVIRSIGMQEGNPVVWFQVDLDRKDVTSPRHFVFRDTGEEFDSEYDLRFYGTFQLPNGHVSHMFEVAR